MLEQESNKTLALVAKKMSDLNTSIIEERNIHEVFAEEEDDALFAVALTAALEQAATREAGTKNRRITIGRFFLSRNRFLLPSFACQRGM